ncbi:hypothetical protein ILUMI_03683 [Ignelater luminosus]|uniref:Uncharacterized protein n=1 Tax=Ignelater luminosus TaxID=2038154 RepID=A0A8K0GI33_IGNLU|nr:hypothetical protein ILUMI_03683 [Ignelater luminosus]
MPVLLEELDKEEFEKAMLKSKNILKADTDASSKFMKSMTPTQQQEKIARFRRVDWDSAAVLSLAIVINYKPKTEPALEIFTNGKLDREKWTGTAKTTLQKTAGKGVGRGKRTKSSTKAKEHRGQHITEIKEMREKRIQKGNPRIKGETKRSEPGQTRNTKKNKKIKEELWDVKNRITSQKINDGDALHTRFTWGVRGELNDESP